jgi:hypothetical protein
MSSGRVVSRILPVALWTFPLLSCSGSPSDSPVLTADMPLHLEDHLDAATIVGSEVPAKLPEPIEWRFDEPQPEWQAPAHRNPYIPPLQMTQAEDVLRITLSELAARMTSETLRSSSTWAIPRCRMPMRRACSSLAGTRYR